MNKFSMNYESKLDMLHKINDFIHARNKRLKTCYNPLLIAETNNANITSLKMVTRDLFNKNVDKAEKLEIHLLGSFMIDKTSEDEPVYTITSFAVNDMGIVVSDTHTITYPEFNENFDEDFRAAIVKTRRETFMAVAVVFTERTKSEEDK